MSEPQSVDWRELPAGQDLDVFVAQKLGARIDYDATIPVIVFTDVTKVKNYLPLLPGYDGWQALWDTEVIARYSTDLNAAFTLFSAELGLEWNLFLDVNDWITCELGHWSDDWHDDQLVQATEKTAALAICKAWLLWQERPDHPAPEFKAQP